MARNPTGENSKKQLLRCIDTRWSITKLMHTPSVYTAVCRIFSFFPRLSFHCIYSPAAQVGVYRRITSRSSTHSRKSARAALSSGS